MFLSLHLHMSDYRILVIPPLEYLERGQRKEVKLKSSFYLEKLKKFLSQMFAKLGD